MLMMVVIDVQSSAACCLLTSCHAELDFSWNQVGHAAVRYFGLLRKSPENCFQVLVGNFL